MGTPLGMLDMAVESIDDELRGKFCKKCQQILDKELAKLKKNLRERKIRWFRKQIWETDTK